MRNRPIPHLPDADKAYIRSHLIFEDADILVFDKPSGLPVQTRGNRGRSVDQLLWAFARSNGKRPRLVHRIDAGTSGLLIAAKTKPAAALLSDQFAGRRVRKTYLALVRGDLPSDSAGTIDVPLIKQTGHRDLPPMGVGEGAGALEASTHWRIIARRNDTALIEARPKSGRMHQIRVHLAHLGCPILGDTFYGAGALSADRLMLHAHKLALEGPKGPLQFEAAPHEDMQQIIDRLV